MSENADTGCIVIIVGVSGALQTRPTWMMATKNLPDWAERIPLIRAALAQIPTELFDRRQIGELFGVSSYQAERLIRDMGPMLHGNSHVVDTEDIRKMLSEVERAREIRNLRSRLAEKDAEIEQALRKSKIQ